MHPSYVAIDAETLRQLYVDERLTTMEIAKRLGCCANTVSRRLLSLGIALRPRGPCPGYWRLGNGAEISRLRTTWSPEVAYAVGLIATDGNLSRQRFGMAVASKDIDLLEALRRCLRLTNRITPYTNGRCYHVQWRDRVFYHWLVSIGLTPAKSLTLGPITVPSEYFADFVRGCIDGDGTIVVYTDRYNATKKPKYVYERLYVSLVSASRPFIDWLRAEVRNHIGPNGFVEERRRPGHAPLWSLRYAKSESIRVLQWMYYSPDLPCLARKRAKAERFLQPLGHCSRRVGRPRAGWVYSRRSLSPAQENQG